MTLDIFKAALEDGIISWFAVQQKNAPTSENRQLLERMCALIQRGGKRARPQLLYMTYVAYEGKDFASLVNVGLALEFHHQFLLIHDDLIDNDTVRYDGPNIVGYYSNDNLPGNQVAQAMGLLAGDLLSSFSSQMIITDKSLTEKQKVALLRVINETNVGAAYGQQLDAYNIDPSPTVFSTDKLLLIHALKSALYSTHLPMRCAAILLDLDSTERQKIDNFAKPFGVLFQLVDDYSDYFTNSSIFDNRPKYRDFRQGKVTYPLYAALQQASPKEAAFIKQNLGSKNLSDEMLAQVVAIFQNCGAQAASRAYLEPYFTQTAETLHKLGISAMQERLFSQLIEKYRV